MLSLKRFLSSLGCFIVVLCCQMVSPAAVWSQVDSSPQWPTFLGPNSNGKSTETGILKDWSNGRLKVKWQLDVGEGYSIGSVASGRYVHVDRKPRDGKTRIRCIDLQSGKQQWTFEYDSRYRDLYGYDSGPRTSPVIDGDLVFVLGVAGQLHCLKLSNGALVWKVDTSEKFGVVQNFFGVGSTPVVHQDKLLVMVGGSTDATKNAGPGRLDQVKPNGSAVVAFDKASGGVVYQTGDDLASYSSVVVTTQLNQFENKPVGLAWCREKLIGFSPDNGKVLFEFSWRARLFESVNASSPVVCDGKVFLSECYGPGSVMLDFSKEKKPVTVWSDAKRRDKAMATHWNTPIYHKGFLYGSSGRNTGSATLNCVDAKTGNVLWRVPKLTRASLTYVDDHMVLLGEYGGLQLIEANEKKYVRTSIFSIDGEENPLRLKHPCWSAPIIAKGCLIIRGKRKVVCFDLK